MFAHAIVSTSRPIALRTLNMGSMCSCALPGNCQKPTTLNRSVASVSGLSRDSVLQSASVSAAACAIVVPGCNRPRM